MISEVEASARGGVGLFAVWSSWCVGVHRCVLSAKDVDGGETVRIVGAVARFIVHDVDPARWDGGI